MKQLGLGLALLAIVAGFVYFYRTPSPTASVDGVSLKLELATTPAARELGLGGRASIARDFGMLFIFPTPDRYSFWMKDTLVPLDIFWLSDQGQVVFMEENLATSTYPTVFYPPVPVRYVLETAAGFGQAHGIATGTPFTLKNTEVVSQ